MQRTPLFVGAAFATVVLLAACGGGGGGSTPPAPAPANAPTTAPTTAPTSAPTTAATNPPSMPSTATISGVSYYVGSNGHTLYELSSDGNDASTCSSSGGCTAIWPPYTAPAGTTAPSGTAFSTFVRSDGTTQWAVNGHPLYDYSGDTAAGTTNGNGIVSFGGTWSDVPSSSSATSSPPPSSSPYAVHTHRP